MTTTNTVRVTKSQKFSVLKEFITPNAEFIFPGTDSKAPYVFNYDEVIAFIDSELALLEKKNTSDKKPTETQKQNEVSKGLILEFLQGRSEGVTCTDIQKGVPEFDGLNNQKIAALVRQLLDAGKVVKATVKGKSLFSIA